MVQFKIQNPTMVEGQSLCRTCRYVHMQKGFRSTEEAIYCGWRWGPLRPVPFNVSTCTDYADRNHPSRDDMEEIAWVLTKPSKGGVVGFRSPQQRAEDEDNEDVA